MRENKRIALVIKTDGLEYDDRVRKEILTVQKLHPEVQFKIFVMYPDNKDTQGVTSYGIPYRSVYIPSRDKYPSAKRTALKSYEFYKAIKRDLKSFDAVWCANEDTAMVVALLTGKPLLWDLHELPSTFLGSQPKELLLRWLFNKCTIVLHANPHRFNYLLERGIIKDSAKHTAIRNFPNFDDVDEEFDDRYYDFIQWKDERKCVYLQGLGNSSRAADESISAVMHFPNLCAVVVGGFDTIIKDKLIVEYGDKLDKRVFFVGKVPQLKIPQYVRECDFSLVFYKNVRPNNWYCEANRFYQAIILGMPVVTGNNPSIKEFVDKYGFGVSIDDDGCDIDKIIIGVNELMKKYDEYKANAIKYRGELLWDKQDALLDGIVHRLLKRTK